MPASTHLRLRIRRLGGHVSVGVWAGCPGFTFGKAGELTFNEAEWPNIRELIQRGGERVEIMDSAWCPTAPDHQHETIAITGEEPRCRHCHVLAEA